MEVHDLIPVLEQIWLILNFFYKQCLEMPIENMKGNISGTKADEKAGFFLLTVFISFKDKTVNCRAANRVWRTMSRGPLWQQMFEEQNGMLLKCFTELVLFHGRFFCDEMFKGSSASCNRSKIEMLFFFTIAQCRNTPRTDMLRLSY